MKAHILALAAASLWVASVGSEAAGAGDVRTQPGSYPAYQPGYRIDYGLGKMDGIPSASPSVTEYAQFASLPSDEERQHMLAYATDIATGNEELQSFLLALYVESQRVAELKKSDPAAATRWNALSEKPAEVQALVGRARWKDEAATVSIEQQLQELKRGPLGAETVKLNQLWSGLHWDLVQRGSYEKGGTAVMTILASATEAEARNRLLRSRHYRDLTALQEALARETIDMAQKQAGLNVFEKKDTTLGNKLCMRVMYNKPDGTPDVARKGYDRCI